MIMSPDAIRELNAGDLDSVSAGAFAGIDALIAVTQQKVDNANNAAMEGAQQQRQHLLHPYRWDALASFA